jgi:hypothetical protein
MIHYHGSPLWPTSAAASFFATRHACVSFARPEQMPLVAEVCQSFILDNGAFTTWTQGHEFDFEGYCDWVREWGTHPGCDFVLIPDAIDAGVEANRILAARWFSSGMASGPWQSVPIWHMDEPLDELQYYSVGCKRVALGSAGAYAEVGSERWWQRMHEAMEVVCDEQRRPRVKLHGLRMLNPTVFSHIPLASADSTNVARNIQYDERWTGAYAPVSDYCRAVVLADRIERHAAAHRWNRPVYGTQMNLELIG